MRFLDPTNDYAFKKIFGDEKKKEILISFLNSILDRREEGLIVEVDLLNPHQVPHLEGAKETILDIRCHDQRGHEYIVEMQVLKQQFFDKRVLYYASKAYSCQLGEGEDYGKLSPVIFLGILNFQFTKNLHWISNHRLCDVETKEHKLKDFDFTFVELPKFVKTEEELLSVSDKWVYFLKHAKNLEAVPEVIFEEAIKEAFGIVTQGAWSQQQLDVYERRKMALMDEAARISSGFHDGKEEGRAEGLAEGLAKGVEKGREEERKAIAAAMLQNGCDVALVHHATKISIEELKTLSPIQAISRG
ncbi:MAG: Rpn family recombination-promoting nuclease/putative transposase [Verrucomicrobia bacterium]|nr:Rpn family recombination-promoting nuclease/putative transposase [Verrucomicrobiota bacterium]